MNESNCLNRKIFAITFLLLVLSAFSCKKEKVVVQGYFESMHFVRQGGGQIDFRLFPTENPDLLRVKVLQVNNRDTSVEYIMGNNNESVSSFSSFQKAINNGMQINGNFQQSTLETGTWAYIYLAYDTKETQVTNTSLRDSLLNFEQIVKKKLE